MWPEKDTLGQALAGEEDGSDTDGEERTSGIVEGGGEGWGGVLGRRVTTHDDDKEGVLGAFWESCKKGDGRSCQNRRLSAFSKLFFPRRGSHVEALASISRPPV